MASPTNMSWYTPVPASRSPRRRITSGTWANAVRGHGARLENMLTPKPAVSPSPSLYDTTCGLACIDVGICLDTYACRKCSRQSRHARCYSDIPVPPRCVLQRSTMGAQFGPAHAVKHCNESEPKLARQGRRFP